MSEKHPVILSGGGPVAMVLGLALWRQDIPVIILEKLHEPFIDQRAASNHPPTTEMLVSLGLGDIVTEGLPAPKYRIWDRESGDCVVEFDLTELADEFEYPYVLQYEQYKTVKKVLELFGDKDGFDVRFSHEVESFTQHADYIDVTVRLADGSTDTIRGSWLVGCDGARSVVRKEAGIDYVGFTYDEHFIKIGTYFDFGQKEGVQIRNFFSDPDEWCNLFKVTGEPPKPEIWRGVFPTRPGESIEDAMSDEGIQKRLQRFFPKQGDYEIAYANVYTVHQRVAETMRKGRVLLAGDAAHANNPIGGMGLNGGVHDAMNLSEKLSRVWRGEADDELLDLYSRQRHKAATDFTQAQTIANKKMMEDNDPASRKARFDEMRRIGDDPVLRRDYMRRAQLVDSLKAAAEVT